MSSPRPAYQASAAGRHGVLGRESQIVVGMYRFQRGIYELTLGARHAPLAPA